jgi:23S rRNA (uridine2552-2'-O)-methyltransferase
MAYNPKDYFFHKAKKENYAARAVFKIQEIDQRFKLFRSGMKVLDLGAAPGSWSQYASQKVGPKGKVMGVDLQPIKITLPNALFITADMRSLDLGQTMTEQGISPPFDLVLSDMAPKTTGVRIQDQMRSFELCMLALETAERFLKPGGHFVAKLFHSDEFEAFRKELQARFGKIEILRPKSTRTESKEIFLIGLGYTPAKKPPVKKPPAEKA